MISRCGDTLFSGSSKDRKPSPMAGYGFIEIDTGKMFYGEGDKWIESPSGSQGPPGPEGPAGADGPAGPQGEQGIQGIQGVKGDTGDAGPAGNDGAQGEQGIQGIQGIQGVQGDTGPQGPQGEPGSGGNPLDAWPVGSVFIAVVSTSPATLLGGGTWAAFGAGRVLVGLDSGNAAFDTPEETGGVESVTLTAAQSGLPAHTHIQQRLPTATGGVTGFTVDTSMSGTVADTGVTTKANTAADASAAHTNLQPYIVVYMWKRTA